MRNKRTFFLGVVIILFLEAIFFRSYLYTDVLFGDTGDGLLNNLIVEHWYQVFEGINNINTLNIFYPVTNTISYTDMLFGLALPYSVLRCFGLDLFLANKIVLIGVHCFGSLTYFYLLNKRIKLSVSASIVGCILAFSSSNVYAKTGHTQLFTMGYVPLLLLFLSCYYESIKYQDKKRYIYGLLSVITFSLILYTSWYIGFFFAFFLLIFFIIVIFKFHVLIFKNMLKLKRYILELFVYLITIIIALIPFVQAYLPTAKLTGTWNWDVVKPMLPSIYDFFNVSGQSLFYGSIFNSNFFTSRPMHWELNLGFPFVTLIVFFIASCYYASRFKQKQYILLATVSITTLISFILLVKIHGFSFWYIVFRFVPGGSAIRAASRYMLFLSFPVSFVIANFFDTILVNICTSKHKLEYLGIVVFVPFFLLIENMHNTGYINDSKNLWTISKQEAIINRTALPKNNLPFYIINSKPKEYIATNYEYQLHSWLIADKYGLKTINGYSGKFPPGWDLFDVINQKYQDRVEEWMLLNGIEALQRYDIADNKWEVYRISELREARFFEGWHEQGQVGRWTSNRKAAIYIPVIGGHLKNISFKAHSFYSNHLVTISINNQIIDEINITPDVKKYTLTVPTYIDQKQANIVIVFFDNNKLLSPKEMRLSEDSRKLGIDISDVVIKNVQ